MQHLEYWNIEHKTALCYEIEKVLLETESQFQKIGFYQSQTEGVIFTLDGFVQLTEKSEYLYHEMLVHPAINTNHDIKKVLIIGGGDCGVLQQVLKYRDIKEVVMVEIDREVIRCCQQFLPHLTDSLNDSRVNLIIDDGFKHIADSQDCYDLIIIDSTDPDTIAKDLFSGDFYQACYNALTAKGVLVAQSETSMIDYFDQLRYDIYHNIKKEFKYTNFVYFPATCYPSGYFSVVIGSKYYNPKEINSTTIDKKVAGFELGYYNGEIHLASLAMSEREKKFLTSINK